MKNRSFALLLAVFLAASMTLMAQPGFRGLGTAKRLQERGVFAGQDFLPARLLLRAKNEIGLSRDQEKKISALLEAQAQWAIKAGAEMRIKALKLRAAAGKNDLAEAERLIREKAELRAELQVARLRLQKNLQAVLTPEQAAKAAQWKKDHREQMRDGRRRQAFPRLAQRRNRRG